MKITQSYTGADASLEILIMLFGAFLLGVLFMWIYNEYFTECIEEEIEVIDNENKKESEKKGENVVVENILVEKQENVAKEEGEKNKEKESEKIEYKKEENEKIIVESEIKEDDLKIIEGVGPKIEFLLKSSGLLTLKKVSETSPEDIKKILREKGGDKYAFHNPAT